MKKNFFVLALALVVLGFSACCSDCNKCEKESVPAEMSECVKGKAKHYADMLTERLELTEEQAQKVECLMRERISKELCARKTFDAQLQETLGAEKFEQFKTMFNDCHKKRPCAVGCDKAQKCEKADSCCKQACPKACAKAEKNECAKKCSKCPNK